MDEKGRDLGVAPVLGDDAWFLSQDLEADLVIGIGFPKVRVKVLERYLAAGARFHYPNLVHPRASTSAASSSARGTSSPRASR